MIFIFCGLVKASVVHMRPGFVLIIPNSTSTSEASLNDIGKRIKSIG